MNSPDFPLRLLDRERILWQGRPAQGIVLVARDWLLIPFSLVWCGFVIFWEATVLHTNAPGFFLLWGVPFVLAGLYFTVGRFVVDAYLRRKTRYALTNRRVLIARSGMFSKLTSINLDRLPEIQFRERADGRGTIRFGPAAAYWAGAGWGAWTPATDPTPQFIAIEDARTVFERIQRVGREAA